MTISKIEKTKLFFVEILSFVLGGFSTFIISIITYKLANEENKKRINKILLFSPILVVILYALLGRSLSVTNKIVVFYTVSSVCNIVLMLIQNRLFDFSSNDTDIVVVQSGGNKKIIVIGIVIFVVLVALLIAVLCARASSKQIEDTNGINNFSLQTISDSDFCDMKVSSVADSVSHSNKGKRSGVSIHGVADYDDVYYSSKKCSGTNVLQSTKSLTDTLVITVDSEIKSGNCRLVVVKNNEIYREVELNKTNIITIDNAKNEEVFVFMGCESADVIVEINRKFS